MFRRNIVLFLLASLIANPSANAEVKLIATGSLSGNIGDLSTKTSAPLENGVPGNLLGGIGSGAYSLMLLMRLLKTESNKKIYPPSLKA